ncbi:MAG: hypothetical protein E6G21_12385 [Actinobacteria bacterium]|nr:MAG: hypothetical protein E6G21_12385 [Actinomycetota bacterium]
MSTIDSSRRQTDLDVARDAPRDGVATRVFLQPIAAPSILGLFGFAGATFIVASNLAGWWGTPESGLALAPFAAMFGGLAQFLAGMWAYRARDAVATAMHGTWGAFWLAYGILNVLVAAGALSAPKPWYHNPEVGFWFFALAGVTASGALASLAESLGLFAVLSTLAAGSGILAGAFIYGSHGVRRDRDDARGRRRPGRPPARQALASSEQAGRPRDAADRTGVGRTGHPHGAISTRRP